MINASPLVVVVPLLGKSLSVHQSLEITSCLLSLTVKLTDAKREDQPALFMLNPLVVRTVLGTKLIGQLIDWLKGHRISGSELHSRIVWSCD